MFFFCTSPKPADDDVVVSKGLKVRTAVDDSVPAGEALEMLKSGNERFVSDQGGTTGTSRDERSSLRNSLSTQGQNPAAIIIACADSRCPVEILFDAQPGDLFVLRNAGNTCTHAEGSIVGSAEYAAGHLGTRLILVLGHTKCGAIAGATATMMAQKAAPAPKDAQGESEKSQARRPSLLEGLLTGLAPVAAKAGEELPEGAATEEVAAHAVRVNVFHTMSKLLEYSTPLRSKVEEGTVQVHGAIYDLQTGQVEFLGQAGSDEHPAFKAE